ncbi:MAG: short-chain dehydrogenase/reductase, partial [Chloroflexota bacterium]
RSFVFTNDPELAEYQPMVDAFTAAAGTPTGQMEAEDVAAAIWGAATDGTSQLRYVWGDGARALLGQRYSIEQDEAFVAGMRARFGS